MTETTQNFEASRPSAGANQDDEHLRLLSIFHWVAAGLTALMSLFASIYVVMGVAILRGAFDQQSHSPPPEFMGWMFIGMGALGLLLGLGLATCQACAARCLARRTHRGFCLGVAGVSCLCVPIGTVLGVFTILVLVRESVRARFT